MIIDKGYMCKNCGKIYHASKHNLPMYCKKCGEDLVKERYLYNLVERNGESVETRNTNLFGGYYYVGTTLTDNVEKVKIQKKFPFGWKLFKGE